MTPSGPNSITVCVTWVFHNCNGNNEMHIDRIRTLFFYLHIIYGDVFIHYWSIEVSAEMYEIIGNEQFPEIFNETIQLRKGPFYSLCYTSRL